MTAEYRREIDGLRGIAVTSVILFHADLEVFSGGFVGVDVFFVISGYLISAILMRELAEGRFSFADFYERRARRILPALAVVIACTIPFAWLWLLPLEMKDFSQSIAAAALSVSNILFWLESDYFDTATNLKPLLHTWSLGVEEQFYLLFPPALLLLWRWPLNRRALAIGLAALASFGLCLVTVGAAPSAAFYLLPFRAWELMAGTLCALWHFRYGRRTSAPLALAGLAALLVSVFTFDKATPFPSAYALLPVAGSCLILTCADTRGLAGRLLAAPPCVGIGVISYSAYLWHQPLLAFGRIYAPDSLSQAELLALASASLPLAFLSWRFVEQPFRARGRSSGRSYFPKALRRTRGRVISLSAATLALAVGFGLWGHIEGGHPSRYTAAQTTFLKTHEWPRRCLFTRLEPLRQLPNAACRFAPRSAPSRGRVALVGDSVMSSLSPAMISYFTARGYEVEQFTHSHCTLTRRHRVNSIDAAACPGFIARVVDYIATEGFDLVITAGAFQGMVKNGVPTLLRTDGAPATRESLALDFRETVTSVAARLLLISPPPRPAVNVRDRAVRELRTHGTQSDYSIDAALYARQVGEIESLFDLALPKGALRIDPGETFCTGGTCHFLHAGAPLLADRTHFTRAGAEHAILPLIDRALRDTDLLSWAN
ncbi:acyltransferase family protein [Alloyangia pacifica]|uniref:acyltransferase family protein n=1 Tax=Alloyangia pacifica TaxID=311180 RepID=UPI001CFE8599|nr:acyltransferase family protein [Alloyangia pacifica]